MLYASTAAGGTAPAALDNLHLLQQAGSLPDDFRDHFFDVPLIVRVEVDGRYLGDARAVLTRDNALSLLEFTEGEGVPAATVERARWLAALTTPRALGPCTSRCPNGLMALHYSLENSLLSIATTQAADVSTSRQYHALPEGGSGGLILRHHVNAYGGDGLDLAGRYALDAQASAGKWTVQASYQLDRSGDDDTVLRHLVQTLQAQREFSGTFVRMGYFLPDFQGITRQPRAPSSVGFTTLGIMAGSSDTLRVDSQVPSLYPVHVTANREGSVEVYRDGSLILTQPLQPGLQALDTRRLPGGIYAVEVRVIEDGRETSRETALIHKPTQWGDPSRRWRYSVFAGAQRSVLDSLQDPQAGEVAVGAVVNHLVHARAVVGLAVQQMGDERALAGSLDWQVNDWANVYTNAYTSNQHGSGVDLQGLVRYRSGSVTLTHNRSWQARRTVPDMQVRPMGWVRTSALGLNHRVGTRSHLSARVSRQRGVSSGMGVDLAFNRRQTLFGTDATWRTALFDRPGTLSTALRRNRGVEFTLNIALGQHGRRYSGSLGTRTGAGGQRDYYTMAGVQQRFDGGLLRGAAAQLTADGAGMGVSGNAQVEHPALRADAYLQRSSLGGALGGGLNLESTLAVGGGRVAVTGAGQIAAASTGMIIDIDTDVGDVALRAHDSHGGSYVLQRGRNLLPVEAYRAGTLQLDFDGRAAPAASIQPAVLHYHLNKGGVGYGKVDVVSTVTVMGHLRDAQGRPLAGAQVINHAGRSVAEADGFFALEMSRRMPRLVVRHPRLIGCTFALDDRITPLQGTTLLAGILACPPSALPARGEAP